MDEKNIYDIFNDVDTDYKDMAETQMSEIEKQRILKMTKERLNINNKKNTKRKFKGKIVAAVIATLIIVGASPLGRDVLADVGRKLFFTPSYGVQEGEALGDIYTLKDPFRIDIDDQSYLIKSVMSSKNGISIELNDSNKNELDLEKEKSMEEPSIDKKIQLFKDELKISTKNGKLLSIDSISSANNSFYWLYFPTNGEILQSFTLNFNDMKLADLSLSKVDFTEDTESLGGSSISSGFQVGATDYYQEGERYFKLWSTSEIEQNHQYQLLFFGLGNDSMSVTDSDGNPLSFEKSQDGTGKAYKLLSDYDGPINLSFNSISVQYIFNNPVKIKTVLPKDNETLVLDKTIYFQAVPDSIVLDSIYKTDNSYTLSFDCSKNEAKSRNIYMLGTYMRSYSAMGDTENQICELYINNEDMTLTEKALQVINLSIDKIEMNVDGNWHLTIE